MTSIELIRATVEAAVWCSRKFQAGKSAALLRSEELRPSHQYLGGDLIHVTTAEGADWSGETIESCDGRLLIFHHELSLSDGSAADLSGGFFDVDNQPPWDTWAWYVQGADASSSGLVSWVPAQLVATVEEGLFANAEICIEWLPASPR